ncbi:MAG: DUF177 domain-containing protein [Rhodothermales bacterium]|nr:DUF177 domain-containing protein [Rhodothermales bacterium]
MVQIELSKLRSGLNEISLTPSPESLEVDADVFSDIRVSVELDVAKGRILARYSTLADAHLECDRTAQPFTQVVEGSHLVLFTSDDASSSDADSYDVRVFAETDRYLDLTDEVRDTLVLSLPARRIAPGAEEVSIPTRFGANEDDDTDPRWDELKKLQN